MIKLFPFGEKMLGFTNLYHIVIKKVWPYYKYFFHMSKMEWEMI